MPPDKRTPELQGEAWDNATIEERQAANAAYGRETMNSRDIPRDDPDLIAVIEALGDRVNGPHAKLAVAEVPAGTRYRIDEYDGSEAVMTVDDYEWSVAS